MQQRARRSAQTLEHSDMSAKAVLETLKPTAEAKLTALLASPYSDLYARPPVEEEVLAESPNRATLCVYRDVLPIGDLRVVVQLVVRGILGTVRIWAHGFRIRDGQAPVGTTDDELYEFF